MEDLLSTGPTPSSFFSEYDTYQHTFCLKCSFYFFLYPTHVQFVQIFEKNSLTVGFTNSEVGAEAQAEDQAATTRS